jgi:hypothetical protein
VATPACTLRTFLRTAIPVHLAYAAVSYTWSAEDYSWYGEALPSTPSTLQINNKVVQVPSQVAHILSILCLFV